MNLVRVYFCLCVFVVVVVVVVVVVGAHFATMLTTNTMCASAFIKKPSLSKICSLSKRSNLL